MLPREGTETVCNIYYGFWNFQLITHVTSRGDGNVRGFRASRAFTSVNNPCYLERGRKRMTNGIRTILSQLITHVTSRGDGNTFILSIIIIELRLITHVTSRGDGNYIYRRCVIADILVNNPCYLERGRKQVMFSILLSFFRLITHVTSRGDGNPSSFLPCVW